MLSSSETFDSIEVLPIGAVRNSMSGLKVEVVGYWTDQEPTKFGEPPLLKYLVKPLIYTVKTQPITTLWNEEISSFSVDIFACDPSWLAIKQ